MLKWNVEHLLLIKPSCKNNIVVFYTTIGTIVLYELWVINVCVFWLLLALNN